MSFLDKAKAAAEQARMRAQEGIGEVQAKRDLAQAYWNLGHKAYELASAGAISHPELNPLIAQISELEGRDGPSGPGAAPTTPEPGAAPTTPGPGAAPTTPEQATDTTPPQSPA